MIKRKKHYNLQESSCASDCSTCYSNDGDQERSHSKRSELRRRKVDGKGGTTSSYDKTNGGNRAERIAVSVLEKQPMSEPAPTRPTQERKAQHEEIDSDNQEQDNTEEVDETSVNPGLSMALEYLKKYQKDLKLDRSEHNDCMDTYMNEQQN